MKDFLKELFEYTLEHDKQLIELFREHPHMYASKAGELFDHALNAHHIWNCRMLGKDRRFGVWDRHEMDAVLEIATDNYNDSLELVWTAELEAMLDYKDTKGGVHKNTYKDMLFHVVNHGTYHRGQVALEFRNHNIDPIISDYIYYKRK